MATSGYVDTNVAPIEGESSIYPKAVRTTWSASFDEATLLWSVTWVTTALGNPSYPSQWTTYHGGTTSFTSSYTMNPASPSGSSGWIEKTRHNQELCKGSFTIAIDDDGNSSFTLNMNYHVNSTGNSGLCTASQLCSLDNKPQASTVSSSGSVAINVYSGSLSATITSRKANYHRLYYGLSESSLTEIALANNGYTASTLTASITYANILAKFPSSPSGTLYFYVRTYKDSGRTQTIGGFRYCAVNVTISASASGIAPTISLGGISVYSSGVNGRLVAGYSRAQSVATVGSPSSSSILRIDYSISYSNGSATTSASNGTNTTIVSPVLPATTSNYTVTINATVYDTRGGHTSASAVAATVFGYAAPNITVNIYRTAASSGSSPARDDAGNYVYVAYSASVYSVDGQNSLQSIGCTRTGESGNIASGSFKYFADDAKDTFTVAATDRVTTSYASQNIYSVRFPLELFDDKNGNMYAKAGGGIITMTGGVMIRGGSESGGNDTRLTTVSGMPSDFTYGSHSRGTKVYSNGIAFADPYNGDSANDGAWIRHVEETANAGYLEIAVGDDAANETVVVRRYNTSNQFVNEVQLIAADGHLKASNNIYSYGSNMHVGQASHSSSQIELQNSTGATYLHRNGNDGGVYDGAFGWLIRCNAGNLAEAHMSHPLSVDSGGTGATSALGARQNLWLKTAPGSGDIGSTEVLVTSDCAHFSAFVMVGYPSTNYQSSCFIPKSALSSTASNWQITDESHYIGVQVRCDGTNLYAKVAATNNGTKTVKFYGLYGA